jgi:hypothetical protein
MKADHPPLLAQGFQDVRLDELKRTFLFPFPGSTTRSNILRKFKHWIKGVKRLNVHCEIWIDGSFATQKVDPQDIDVVIFIRNADIRRLSADKKAKLLILTNERLTTEQKKKCICDSYLGFPEDIRDREGWEKIFGQTRAEMPKGIFRIFI